jgi:hypothetical protein
MLGMIFLFDPAPFLPPRPERPSAWVELPVLCLFQGMFRPPQAI